MTRWDRIRERAAGLRGRDRRQDTTTTTAAAADPGEGEGPVDAGTYEQAIETAIETAPPTTTERAKTSARRMADHQKARMRAGVPAARKRTVDWITARSVSDAEMVKRVTD